jgi:hypothetical protein
MPHLSIGANGTHPDAGIIDDDIDLTEMCHCALNNMKASTLALKISDDSVEPSLRTERRGTDRESV